MGAILTDLGEEWVIKNNLVGAAITVGLYNDTTDAITDAEDLADITTEPSNGNYVRQSATLEADDDGDWHAQINAQASFDVTDTTGTIDSYFILVTFQAVDTSDGAPTLHLVATGALSQSRDLSQIDTLNLASGSVGIKLS